MMEGIDGRRERAESSFVAAPNRKFWGGQAARTVAGVVNGPVHHGFRQAVRPVGVPVQAVPLEPSQETQAVPLMPPAPNVRWPSGPGRGAVRMQAAPSSSRSAGASAPRAAFSASPATDYLSSLSPPLKKVGRKKNWVKARTWFLVCLTASLAAYTYRYPASIGAYMTNTISSLHHPFDWRPWVAGGFSAALSHGLATPIDVIKTRMQACPWKYNGNVRRAYNCIMENEGWTFLLQGLFPTVVGYTIQGAVKFGLYEHFKPMGMFTAATIAGVIASVVLCPAEDARIRMVTDPDFHRSGPLETMRRLYQDEGVLAAFSGIPAMVVKQVPYTITKQCSFDVLATLIYVAIHKHSWIYDLVPFFAAVVAAVLSCIASQPGDVILTETYKGKKHESFISNVAEIRRKSGWRGFFSGTKPRLVHVGMIITIQLMSYDMMRVALGLPRVGH